MGLYEIGVVYRKNARFFLAVSDRTLITYRDGGIQEVKPYVKYDAVRTISVEELCRRWGVSLDHLDTITSKYLAPANEGIKPRPRGSRRRRVVDEQAWRNLRLIRLARTA
jgi:hypothetical protein